MSELDGKYRLTDELKEELARFQGPYTSLVTRRLGTSAKITYLADGIPVFTVVYDRHGDPSVWQWETERPEGYTLRIFQGMSPKVSWMGI